jgi:hypothetical protein
VVSAGLRRATSVTSFRSPSCGRSQSAAVASAVESLMACCRSYTAVLISLRMTSSYDSM